MAAHSLVTGLGLSCDGSKRCHKAGSPAEHRAYREGMSRDQWMNVGFAFVLFLLALALIVKLLR
jgi:hypothetical protein